MLRAIGEGVPLPLQMALNSSAILMSLLTLIVVGQKIIPLVPPPGSPKGTRDACDITQPPQWTWYTGQNITGGAPWGLGEGRPQVECVHGSAVLPICDIGFLWPSSITCNSRAGVEGWACTAKDKAWMGYHFHMHCGDQPCLPASQCSVRFDARPVVSRTLRGIIAVVVMGALLIVFVFVIQMNDKSGASLPFC